MNISYPLPFSRQYLMEGSAAVMRWLFVIAAVVLSWGTLKSTRIKTRLSLTSTPSRPSLVEREAVEEAVVIGLSIDVLHRFTKRVCRRVCRRVCVVCVLCRLLNQSLTHCWLARRKEKKGFQTTND